MVAVVWTRWDVVVMLRSDPILDKFGGRADKICNDLQEKGSRCFELRAWIG